MAAGWRERVERDLGGASFERALVTELAGGLRVQPLYEAAVASFVPGGATELAVVAVGGGAGPVPVANERVWRIGAGEGALLERHDGENTRLWEAGREVAHGIDVHDAGGSIPLELGVALARWLDALRAGHTEAAIGVAVGPEMFVEVSKLRALRSLATRAGTALLGSAPRVRLVSRSSLVPFSRIEEETNALRATLSAVAAIVGGADLNGIAPFAALTGDAAAESTASRAARLAATTGLVARFESHLDATMDPAHGSYLVEALTRDIASATWTVVRDLESQGGAARSPDRWRTRLVDESQARAAAAAAGKLPRVGASRLARHDAPLAPPVAAALAHVVRDAAPFESVRDERLARPTTLIVAGDARRTAARADYVRDVLACWGAPQESLRFASIDAAVAAIGADAGVVRTEAVALCVEDADFERLGPLVHLLARDGELPRAVLVAGRPGPHEAGLRAAGARSFVHLGSDLPRAARTFFATTPVARHSQPPRGIA